MDEMMPNQEQQREDKLQSRIERLVDLFKPELREALIPAMYSLVKSQEVAQYHKGDVDMEKLKSNFTQWFKDICINSGVADSKNIFEWFIPYLQPRAESEAVEFMEWSNDLNKCQYYPVYNKEASILLYWENRNDFNDKITTKQLYTEFLKHKQLNK